MQSKLKTMECMEVCATRQRAGLSCRNCQFFGKDCIDSHEYARLAVLVAKQKEVEQYATRTEQHRGGYTTRR